LNRKIVARGRIKAVYGATIAPDIVAIIERVKAIVIDISRLVG
jgi:hypothetical protein